ncbi:MAG TPA: malto-oligosyltrehalose synthase [Polyangia bacterium]|nr:malto-oligosyltrehalose synthase [Polyangia bacterium]
MSRAPTGVGGAPLATYRLQLSPQFTLADARALVPYLDLLGVSHVYASPLLASRAGSTHGYDVVAHGAIDRALGTEDDLVAFGHVLADRGMGLIVDLVPNHMCIADEENQRWRDVLENGQGSVWVDFFDIDWGPPKPALAGKVLLPILGDQFGRELESGALAVELHDGAFRLRHGDHVLPLAPPSWRLILEPLWRRVSTRAGGEAEAAVEVESILRALGHWPTERVAARARRHERDAIVRRLAALASADGAVADDLTEVLREINGTKGVPRSFDVLETLVEAQPYRLAHWRVAADEINYRRFFDINDLAAIRVEREDVFRAVHELPARWVERGLVSGFRVDHVDGLLEPARYLARLRALADRGPTPAATILVEKILADDETLPDDWPVDGTTGYDHLAATAGVLVDADNAAAVRAAWTAVTHETQPWVEVAYESRRLILETALAAELNVLARRLDAISEDHRYTRDFTFASLHEALREVLSCFPVYRTYVARDATEVRPRDRDVILRAVRAAARRNPVVNRSLFQFIEDLLLLKDPEGLTAEQVEARRDFVLRLQQLTGPVAAKGVEDTAFYRYFPLLSLAEVGGDPDRLGISVAEFHAIMRRRAAAWPHALSATGTHDTKRGEDARARLHVLSEVPEKWREAVLSWRALNAPVRAASGIPDPLTEVFIYAALVGGWPGARLAAERDFGERFSTHIAKSIAEAKLHTSWINPDASYEEAVASFVRSVLDAGVSAPFLASLDDFVSSIVTAGVLNSLAQTLLKVAAPGVPDIYWGDESWDFSFADPDNRRAVDFERRVSTLGELRRQAEIDAARTTRDLLARPQDGAIKTFVLHRALVTRASRRDAFESPTYEACAVRGPRERHVVAFARGEPGRRVFALTGRLFARLTADAATPVGDVWRDTTAALPAAAPGTRYREALTGRTVTPMVREGTWELALSEVFETLPLALVVEETP